MDALSDPRAYLSAQEKRTEQLKAIGVDENDINTNDVIATKKTTGSGSGSSRAGGGGQGSGAGNAASAAGGAGSNSAMPSIPGILPTKKPLEKGNYESSPKILLQVICSRSILTARNLNMIIWKSITLQRSLNSSQSPPRL